MSGPDREDGRVTRRQFLQRAGTAAFAATGLTAGSAYGRRPGRLGPRFWTWVHGGGERTRAQWGTDFGRLRDAGIEAVLVAGGETAMLSDAARGEGLEFHRWIWTLNRSGDAFVKERHPEWFTVSRNGESSLEKPPYVGYYQWLCPTREPVRDYLRGIVDALARDPAIDGVHLDYVRHCDVILPVGLWAKYGLVQDRELAEFDFCYCDVCRSTFESMTGRDPSALADPASDVAWREFRWDGVTALVRGLAAAVHALGKPITAAVFPTPAIARKLVRQAWESWPLDAVFPMLYHAFYEEDIAWIGSAVAEGAGALADRPLHAGLYLPDLTPAQLADAARLAIGAGAAGISVFEMGGLTAAHRNALRGVAG